jgi:hypothetical protein
LAYLNTYRAVIHIHAYWRDDLVAPVDLGAWREISSAAIAHGRRHYSESGEPLATTLAVLEYLQREGFVYDRSVMRITEGAANLPYRRP